MEKTIVIFRVFPEGDVLALFPTEPAGPGFCSSYQHLGQHGSADYTYCIGLTKQATPAEYDALKKELIRIGYNDLKIQKRFTRKEKV